MSDADWSERTIRDIVTSNPVAMQLFREHGIDFCCNGDRELAEAVDQLEISQKELYLALDAIREKGHPAGLPDYAGMTAGNCLIPSSPGIMPGCGTTWRASAVCLWRVCALTGSATRNCMTCTRSSRT